MLRPGDRGVPSSWGSGDSEPPRVKVNLPVLAGFSGPLHAVWSEDRRPRTRVPGRGRWGWGTRVGEPGTRVATTITPCACPRTRDSHPGTRVEKVPRALEFEPTGLPSGFSSRALFCHQTCCRVPQGSPHPTQQQLEAMAPAAPEFFTQGRAGHAVPMAPEHSGYSQEIPGTPRPCRAPMHPAVPLQTRPGISGSGNKTSQRPQPSSVSPIPKYVKTSGEGGRDRFDAFCGEGLKYRRVGTGLGGQDGYTIDASASCSPHCLSVSPGKGSSSDLGNLRLSANLSVHNLFPHPF